MKKKKIAIIGLGYVGLPLAVEFSKKRTTIGYDINQIRIDNLINGVDTTLEISKKKLKEKNNNLNFTTKISDIKKCEIFIITVPTPIDKYKRPDLTALKKSSELVGSILKKGDIVIYESTVYPGATEEICVPILQKFSGLIFNKHFFCGYSPERINPGDKNHTIADIKKVTSGSNSRTANEIDKLYQEIIKSGTHLAKSIKIAEAAKVIENTQRDVNIALINELSIIFHKLNIDTTSVLEAAGTKWNFLPFRPGLVGGHCIGVDPHYLAHKSIEIGYTPEIIISGRKLNDSMGFYIVDQIIKLMTKKNISLVNANILLMGITFKENCPDVRNSRVFDLYKGLADYNINIDVYDPWIKEDLTILNKKIKPINKIKDGKYDAIIIAVAHDEFKKISIKEFKKFGKKKHIIYDIKSTLNSDKVDGRL
jgi:UDP-N-acetyl-D-galactosamine dehydrogenase